MTDNSEFIDILVIGAGLSGIGSACRFRRDLPGLSLAILESRPASGGTWDLFRYPGIRSDSDMYTYSYGFKPWTNGSAIADGDRILKYIRETADEYGLNQHIRYNHKVMAAHWSSQDKLWTVTVTRASESHPASQETLTMRCRFILSCTGYYDYDQGYTPEFTGIDHFNGDIVHPQFWPETLDYKDKRVVIVGSGATAVTLVPNMANDTANLVMLQRSPTYIATVPAEDPWLKPLRKYLPDSWVYRLIRWKKVLFQQYIYRLSRRKPAALRKFLLDQVREELGPEYDVKTHFTPSYKPWDQRLCAVPDGDMFAAIREGKAEVVTDHVENFNHAGIALKSGRQLDADIVILATGLQLKFGGGIAYYIDGEEVELTEHFVYRGMMLSGVPNFAMSVGYTNSSWTLKTDLTANYVCELFKKMERGGHQYVIPVPKEAMDEAPLLDFNAGYVLRGRDLMPKNGDREPWKNSDRYTKDFVGLKLSRNKYNELEFH
ncbi:FAD-containing monooxygenase EthA [Halioglobus japonicus]|uniref:NAD(P)/FAD-dependent oxidoreductase n=1 Tax=Halioglobus japonicus TaxID=930805 RepID=A0AAP8ME89_9GAMM|nr:NAD(P)/FAD-dependent oxidoreductase [Halioglobus japonicus]AQA18221.1 FAD-containing monooxygenase EthA [Halioglobus japonicus]PLW86228.1 NAD(P)/FAD-dependent oxidoreductase [Halioglobus japonicus]GHD13816.1 cyclohexanone monooxygenase [Halioglobus japonicus]